MSSTLVVLHTAIVGIWSAQMGISMQTHLMWGWKREGRQGQPSTQVQGRQMPYACRV
jgi:hypothetical protein